MKDISMHRHPQTQSVQSLSAAAAHKYITFDIEDQDF